jgi:Protein of unknown function (DUF4232)
LAPRSLALAVVALTAAGAAAYVGAHSAVASRRAVAPCKTDQLSGSDAGFDGAAVGILSEAFALHSEKTCALGGSPSVTLLGSNRSVIGRHITGQVGTDAPSVTLSSKHPAYFDLVYGSPSIPVPQCTTHVYAVVVTAPGATGSLEISLRRHPLIVCHRGKYPDDEEFYTRPLTAIAPVGPNP